MADANVDDKGERWKIEERIRVSALPPSSRLILLSLLTRSDAKTAVVPPKFSPSLTALASDTGLSRRAVMDHLNRLEGAGWVVRLRPSVAEARSKKAKTSYLIAVPEPVDNDWPTGAGDALGQEVPQAGAGGAPELGQEVPRARAGDAHVFDLDPLPEHLPEPSRSTGAGGALEQGIGRAEIAQAVLAEQSSWSLARVLTEVDLDLAAGRTPEDVMKRFVGCARDPIAMGPGLLRVWKPSSSRKRRSKLPPWCGACNEITRQIDDGPPAVACPHCSGRAVESRSA